MSAALLHTPAPGADLGAMVLAAGLGTRLRPLTAVLPKAAVPVLGRPLAAYALIRLHALGVREVTVNAHHLADRLVTSVDAWVTRRLPDLTVHWSVEAPEVLGTGGALVRVRERLQGGTFAVWNADILADVDLGPALEFHRRREALCTLVLVEHPQVERYGAVVADADGRVVDLAGVARREGRPGPQRRGVFTGVQLLEPAFLDLLPAAGASCVVRQGHAPAMERGLPVCAFFHRGSWSDLGTPRRYLDAHLDLLRGDDPLPTAFGAGEEAASLGLRALFQECAFAADAQGRLYGDPATVEGIAGADLRPPFAFGPGCSLGPGARIGPGAVLGARVEVGAGALIEEALTWSFVRLPPGDRLVRAVAWAEASGQRRLDVDPA